MCQPHRQGDAFSASSLYLGLPRRSSHRHNVDKLRLMKNVTKPATIIIGDTFISPPKKDAFDDGGSTFRLKWFMNDATPLNPKSSEIGHFFLCEFRRVLRQGDFSSDMIADLFFLQISFCCRGFELPKGGNLRRNVVHLCIVARVPIDFTSKPDLWEAFCCAERPSEQEAARGLECLPFSPLVLAFIFYRADTGFSILAARRYPSKMTHTCNGNSTHFFPCEVLDLTFFRSSIMIPHPKMCVF